MTNPTPEQIEAAAKALEKFPINLITRKESREAAHAALVAADVATPQAPGDTAALIRDLRASADEGGYDTAELCRRAAGALAAAGVIPQGGTPPTDDREAIVEALVDDAWEGHDSELDIVQLDLIAGTVIDAGFTRAAPVQVEEAKLVEILEAHTPALDQTACYMGYCDCMEHVSEYEFYRHVAEKVAVWLQGGGR